MSDLRWWVERMRGKRAYVVGDAIVDQYEFGSVSRICPEAPVPVFVPEHAETRQGGAANVANNLSALGLEVETTFAPMAQWSKKTRYMVGAYQLLRVDEDQQGELEDSLDAMREKLKGASVLVLSDYAKGSLTLAWCQFLIGAANEIQIPVVVDPKADYWGKYSDCDVICPNEAEWKAWQKVEGAQLLRFRAMLLKLGARGLHLSSLQSDYGRVPAREVDFPAHARRVFDVTGAGDTVVAAVAATLAAGGDLDAAAQIANAAAGVVVEEIGTSVCTAAQLLERLA